MPGSGQWDYEISKAEPAVWMLSRLERWGTIAIPFDLHERIEFSYYISIEDNDYGRVLEHDHYLGRLGFNARSACRVASVDTCAEKFWKVAELINWQVNEYTRLIECLIMRRGSRHGPRGANSTSRKLDKLCNRRVNFPLP